MKKITIAIDGYSSTGKSTLAKQLAAALGYVYVDTGAMYRGITYFAMQHHLVSETKLDKSGLIAELTNINLSFQFNSKLGFAEMYLNNENIETKIRTIEVSRMVSKVAEISEVRAKLVEQQQTRGKDKGIVMDGRDIGTVVFPDAEVKFFITASPEIRAQRRFEELRNGGNESVTFDEVKSNLLMRDQIDSTRAESPLIQAEDAIIIDTSFLTREEQLERALVEIKKREIV